MTTIRTLLLASVVVGFAGVSAGCIVTTRDQGRSRGAVRHHDGNDRDYHCHKKGRGRSPNSRCHSHPHRSGHDSDPY